MESRHLMITILGAAFVWGGVGVIKAWVAVRQEEKRLDQTVEISRQETERLKVFAQAMGKKSELAGN